MAQIGPDFILTENVERYLSFTKNDEEMPAFLLYPYLTQEQIAYSPGRDFAEALSAILSFPRKPYQVFADRFGRR